MGSSNRKGCLKYSIIVQEIGQLRNEAREKELQLKEKEQFHESEVANNREIEKKISASDRTYVRLKQELQDAERLRDTFNSEVSTLPITFLHSIIRLQKLLSIDQ